MPLSARTETGDGNGRALGCWRAESWDYYKEDKDHDEDPNSFVHFTLLAELDSNRLKCWGL